MMIVHGRDSDWMPSPVPPGPTAIVYGSVCIYDNLNDGRKGEKELDWQWGVR
jgi:hypothetical protein